MSRKRTPGQEPSLESATAVAEPPATETPVEGQSFAERVGQRKVTFAPDPYSIAADYMAGVQLFESKRERQMAIKFGNGSPEDKPSQAVIDKVKDAGFRWNSEDRVWSRPVRSESAMSTRIEAERLYQEVRQMIRQEKGIGAGQEIPF